MRIKIWGCRGSLPSPGPENMIYGGNTSCIQVLHKNTCIVLDGGSGIQRLGKYLEPGFSEVHILLTHLHIDHTMGLGFFQPLYDPKVNVHFWGPSSTFEPLVQRLRRYFSPPLFPVRMDELPTHPVIHELNNMEFSIGEIKINTSYICHPGPTLGYRLDDGESVFTYLPDHEPELGSSSFPYDPEWTSGYDLARNADLLFHDGEYTSEEYKARIGWGHSSIDAAIDFGKLCGVNKLGIFHHDPLNSDDKLEDIFNQSMKIKKPQFNVELCKEGAVYDLGGGE